MIDLNVYVAKGLFLKNLAENGISFDKIIFDIPSDLAVKQDNIVFLNDKLEFSISWAIQQAIGKSKKVLIILQKFNLFHILPFLKIYKNLDYTIIGLNVGSIGVFDKFYPEYNDVSQALDYFVPVYEPVDFVDFFQILEKQPWPKYIRLTSKDWPNNIFAQVEWNYDELINFAPFGVSGERATILTQGYLLPESLQSIERLNNEDIFVDLFVMRKYNFTPTDEFVDSLRKTERLIVILDNIPSLYISFIKSILYDINLPEVVVEFIFAKNEKITVVQKEYLLEKVALDWLNLYKRLKKFLQS